MSPLKKSDLGAALESRDTSIPAEQRAGYGVGVASCHHGELLQGVFMDQRRQPRRALVTLPMSARGTRAVFRMTPVAYRRADVTVWPADRTKAKRAAELAVEHCARASGRQVCAGALHLTSDVPVGLGMGSSTSDVIAAIRAVAASYRVLLSPDETAHLAVAAEHASDSIMIEEAVVLFAHREGESIERLSSQLPGLMVVGCVGNSTSGVDTLKIPPFEYGDDELQAFEKLRDDLRWALESGDTKLLGRVATASALINQRYLPKRELDSLIALSEDVGAVGVQVAHSGTVSGVIFDASADLLLDRVNSCRNMLSQAGVTHTDTFYTGNVTPWRT